MGYNDGLGRAGRMHVTGESVTREQASEIMLRTNRWCGMFCNDEEWELTVASVLGLVDRFDALVEAEECKDSWEDWLLHRSRLAEQFGDEVGALKLGHLDNDAIMGCWDKPGGWMSWDGTIRADWTIGVKYPEVADIEAEWATIAEAFPFLKLRAQALSGGFGCCGAAPKHTVIAEWTIDHGHVTRIYHHPAYPPAPLLPIRWREGWWEDSRLRYWWQYDVGLSRPWGWVTAPWWAARRRRHRAAWPQPYRTLPGEEGFAERFVSAPRLIEAVDQVTASGAGENKQDQDKEASSVLPV